MLAGKQCAKVCLPQKASLAPIQFLRDSTAQHSTAQHSTAQHSTAQHSTAQLLQLFKIGMLLVLSRHTGSQAWHQK